MKVSTILDRIDSGSIALPEFQRGYVWNRTQVRKLMRSLYRGYPIGSLLMWETQTDPTLARGDSDLAPGVVNLLLDGQQRITSLYGIIRDAPPPFFDGDESRFLGLYFNLDTEEFEFYGPVKMRDDPRWINVTEVMQIGVGQIIGRMAADPVLNQNLQLYIDQVNAIGAIKDRDLHVETVTGVDKDIDVVVDIFNEVNSGGTKLSKGDLALAKVCAAWSDARGELKTLLAKWKRAGFSFDLDWLMRCITTVTTGEARFVALEKVTIEDFAGGLRRTEQYIDTILNLIGGRLGLDHNRVLTSRGALPLLVRYLHQRGGRFANHAEQDQLLYWYVHTMLWGRYSASTESTLDRDLSHWPNEISEVQWTA